ncbi:type II toxin-antitoxin system PemK/MazF family toxin [Candidatus Woesearchaeota archaeon]|nr:type II toxin-antitoxin system PemK/MazF family toxin [Candidatus Woesearchaeota archaeon]
MNQQDIIWVKFPFSSFQESKVRPAIIISNDDYNKKGSDAIICAITSNLDKKPYSIIIDNNNLSAGKLPIRSKMRADKILQIEKNLLLNSFAKLDNKTFDILVEEINKVIKRK